MARRRKSSGGGLINLFALMPWWACAALAVVAYFGLHAWADKPAPKVRQGALAPQLNSVVTGTALNAAANVGQYALPLPSSA